MALTFQLLWIASIGVIGCGGSDGGSGGSGGTGGSGPDAGGNPDTNSPAFSVQGTAAGVIRAVALRLRHDGGQETMEVSEDGNFAFTAQIAAGGSYEVEVISTEADCRIENAVGEVVDANPMVTLYCDGLVSLMRVALSGPLAAEAMPGLDEQSVLLDVPFLQSTAAVTVYPLYPEATIALGDLTLIPAVPSTPQAIALGANAFTVTLEHASGLQRTYELSIRRANELAQYVYGKASNPGNSDNFGYAVALDGDTLAIGAFGEDSNAVGINGLEYNEDAPGAGAVYVFRRAGGLWEQEAYIKASNTEADEFFGRSVALSGDTLAVGASREDSGATGVGGEQSDNSAPQSGAVYIFRRGESGWEQEAYIKASNTGADDSFGFDVALDGDVLAVSALQEDSGSAGIDGDQSDNSAPDSGAVYVFRRNTAGWEQEAYIKAAAPDSGDYFGLALALQKGLLAVGAYLEDSGAAGAPGNNSAQDSGAVYLYRYQDSTWVEDAYLKAPNIDAGDNFGIDVAVYNDTVAIGAWGEDSTATGVGGDMENDSGQDSGAAYVFRRAPSGGWEPEAYVKASNTEATDRFGISVAIVEDRLAVGAYQEDSSMRSKPGDNSRAQSGAVYLFERTNDAWEGQGYIKASNAEADDRFGFSLALDEEGLVVGADGEDSADGGINGDESLNNARQSGAVYLFH